uniref:Uncharacterized protein n=1 Tax=Anguilla anguilla TaxID=7936 RepID=A0A0E9PA65_ANGAN
MLIAALEEIEKLVQCNDFLQMAPVKIIMEEDSFRLSRS